MTTDYEIGDAGFQFLTPGEVLSPVDTNLYLQLLVNQLGKAQLWLRKARRLEVDAEEVYAKAKAPLMEREDCPEVGTRAGQVSQKARDAWFADRAVTEFMALRRATAKRQAAYDYMRTVENQMEVMRSLNKTALTLESLAQGGGAR